MSQISHIFHFYFPSPKPLPQTAVVGSSFRWWASVLFTGDGRVNSHPGAAAGAGFPGRVIPGRSWVVLGSGLWTNVLGQEGIGWLGFSGDTRRQGEPRVPRTLASWGPPALGSASHSAVPSEGCAGSKLTVWEAVLLGKETSGRTEESSRRVGARLPGKSHTRTHIITPSQAPSPMGVSAQPPTFLESGSVSLDIADIGVWSFFVEQSHGRRSQGWDGSPESRAVKSRSLSGVHSANILARPLCIEHNYRQAGQHTLIEHPHDTGY